MIWALGCGGHRRAADVLPAAILWAGPGQRRLPQRRRARAHIFVRSTASTPTSSCPRSVPRWNGGPYAKPAHPRDPRWGGAATSPSAMEDENLPEPPKWAISLARLLARSARLDPGPCRDATGRSRGAAANDPLTHEKSPARFLSAPASAWEPPGDRPGARAVRPDSFYEGNAAFHVYKNATRNARLSPPGSHGPVDADEQSGWAAMTAPDA